MSLVQIAVLVPLYFAVAVRDLHESNSPFEKPAGHQTLPAEIFGDGVVDAVQFLRCGGFSRKILNFGHRRLHAKGKLEGIQTSFECLIVADGREVIAIHRGDQIELTTL